MVAGSRLRDLREQRVGVAKQQVLKHSAPVELFSERLHGHPHSIARNLYDGPVGRCIRSEERLDAHHSFVTHNARFDARAVFHSREQRDEGVLMEEIDVPDVFTKFIKRFAASERDKLQVLNKSLELLLSQCGQKSVVNWNARVINHLVTMIGVPR